MKAEALLYQGIAPLWAQLEAKTLAKLAKDFGKTANHQADLRTELLVFLIRRLDESQAKLEALDEAHQRFTARYRTARPRQRPQHLLDFAVELGASPRQLAGDKRALKRSLDDEAMGDRYRRKRGELERRQRLLLERLGILGRDHVQLTASALARFVGPNHGAIVRTTALEALASLTVSPTALLERLPKTLPSYLEGLIADETCDVWVRCAALSLLNRINPAAAFTTLIGLFRRPQEGDQRFLRHRGLHILSGSALTGSLALIAIKDPSPFVRQALCRVLAESESSMATSLLRHLALRDETEAVQGAAILTIPQLATRNDLGAAAYEILFDALAVCTGFTARVAIHTAGLMADEPARIQALQEALDALRQRIEDPIIRREAAQMRERLWCLADPFREQLRLDLARLLNPVTAGRAVKLPVELFARTDEQTFGRVLAVLAQQDFGIDVEGGLRGYRLRKTPRFGFSWWRAWYEFTHPAPDKRQGYSHCRGRRSQALFQAPSGVLGETSPTRVPGEPQWIAEEGDARPYLPLPSDALASLDLDREPMRLYTHEGVVQLQPPKGLWSRLRAATRLTFGFAKLARLRNWRERDAFAPNAYANTLRDLDFNLSIEVYGERSGSHTGRFFAGAPLYLTGESWTAFREYVGSIYDNSLRDLALFAGVGVAVFLGRAAWLHRRIRRARKAIPLSIGGWGTRGKSGVERLKAALFNGLGVRFVAKTTGCEARLIVSPAMGMQQELPLFRPMGKASIWEQGDVTRFGAKMRAETLLWECMGLNPIFVRVLQREWMRDSLATLTNAHPDHEDIQGPSGMDVARTIAEFIPDRAHVITAEEQMTPILRETAAQRSSNLDQVGWLEAGLLAPDILDRFPYEEHPYNIALVAGVARHFGVEEDFALKEMSDRVVPDLGVLKCFEPAPVVRRRLSFASGNSANERLGCMNNWKRSGFQALATGDDPQTIITIVANNRSDRMARAQVFAQILARDLSYDQIVLIGSDLGGMKRALKSAWHEVTAECASVAGFQQMSAQLRIPIRPDQVRERLGVMLTALSCDADFAMLWDRPEQLETALGDLNPEKRSQLLDFLNRHRRLHHEYRDMLTRLEGDADIENARTLLRQWLQHKVLILNDTDAHPIMEAIIADTPFGMHNHLMGVQNIKGPGAALINLFQQWEAVGKACEQLQSEDRQEAVNRLESLGRPNLLARETFAKTLDQIEDEDPDTAARLRPLLETEQSVMRKPISAWRRRLSSMIAAITATGNAVKHRKRADRIYRDLAQERIGFRRAAIELSLHDQSARS